jgi:predicted ThiF/HesA family dinucleotide-utilizing enzyme
MLRARMSNGVFILGLDAENIKRLKEGKPILISLAELGGTDDVLIMFGKTIEDIKQELVKAFGGLPKPTLLDELRKPQ